jgi:hypothetical protein
MMSIILSFVLLMLTTPLGPSRHPCRLSRHCW